MDRTINRGYPYPECAPPLTKDASDIAHLFNLAQAVAEDVQSIYDRADDVLIRPDACRRSGSGMITTNEAFPDLTATTFDTTGGAMSTGTTGIRLVEPGWYLVGGMVQAVSVPSLALRLRVLLNGQGYSSFSPYSAVVQTDQQSVQYGTWVFSSNPDGIVSFVVRNGTAMPSFAYTLVMWAQQGAKV